MGPQVTAGILIFILLQVSISLGQLTARLSDRFDQLLSRQLHFLREVQQHQGNSGSSRVEPISFRVEPDGGPQGFPYK